MATLVNAEQMRKCDQYTIETIGLPSMVLMERAALAVYRELTKKEQYDLSQTLVVCGTGNNGGDGLALARLLFLAGYPVTILLVGNEEHFTAEAAQQFRICQYYEIPVLRTIKSLMGYTMLVDSYLGIGATGSLTEEARETIHLINNAELPILAVDIPSGIDASTGESLGAYVKADKTVTFQFKKTGFTISPGMEACGKLKIADIGISDDALDD